MENKVVTVYVPTGYSSVQEFLDDCGLEACERVSTPPTPSAGFEKEADLMPYLKNYADGVNGHYCIARYNPKGFTEHYSHGDWCSAGQVFELHPWGIEGLAEQLFNNQKDAQGADWKWQNKECKKHWMERAVAILNHSEEDFISKSERDNIAFEDWWASNYKGLWGKLQQVEASKSGTYQWALAGWNAALTHRDQEAKQDSDLVERVARALCESSEWSYIGKRIFETQPEYRGRRILSLASWDEMKTEAAKETAQPHGIHYVPNHTTIETYKRLATVAIAAMKSKES